MMKLKQDYRDTLQNLEGINFFYREITGDHKSAFWKKMHI